MAIYSPLRSRRLAAQQVEVTQRLLTFELRTQSFAIPLDRIHRVTTLNSGDFHPGRLRQGVSHRLYGDPHQTGVSLTTYQGNELVVIDVGHRIFGSTDVLLPTQSPDSQTVEPVAPAVRYLLIVQPEPDRLVGVPIDSAPSIQSMPISAFKPLPAIYQQYSQIHCVSAMSIDLPDRPSIFLLDIDTLARPE